VRIERGFEEEIMCESYHLKCQCGKKSAEIFFGKMLLDKKSVHLLFCPECGSGHDFNRTERIWDNGWILELNMDIIKSFASTFGMQPQHLTANWIFDSGYVTWAGITPDDTETRNREREEILALAKSDLAGYLKAMKEWGITREKRFTDQGWRKMKQS
jgi:hypothetical protein